MTIDFISDLHLDKTRPHVNKHFVTYMNNISKDTSDLFILGDLFEYWVGDDDPMDGLEEVKSSIIALSKKIKVWYMHGNRDFLVSKKICKNLGMQELTDPYLLEIDDLKILLMHGDTLCTDDIDYQSFRTMVRSKEWQTRMLSKSLDERLKIAEDFRKKSAAANSEKNKEIMDVNIDEINKHIKKYKPEVLIHGHTHRPNIHQHSIDNYKVTRYVLGDWYDKFFILTLRAQKFTILKGKLK
jgi:UDP-2,3-diacylglucosamine hydrolase